MNQAFPMTTDDLENKELRGVFRRHKTEMACMENPRTFLFQLRDHDLLPDNRYQEMSRMRSKDNLKKAIYEFLDWLEVKQPQLIPKFWRAIFKEITMKQYPTLRGLHYSLMNVSETFSLGNKVEQEARDKRQKELSGNEGEEERNATSEKKKRKKVKGSRCVEDEDKQSKASSVETPGQKRKSRKPDFSSPLKKGEKNNIWSWPLFQVQLPVTCGDKDGLLDRKQMAKGQKCIMVNGEWMTPPEFEHFAGKQNSKKWRLTIKCMNTPLGKLIEGGHLKSTRFLHQTVKARKSLFRANPVITDDEDKSGSEKSDPDDQPSTSGDQRSSPATEGELTEQAEQEAEVHRDICNTAFKVTCGALFGTLDKNRFASGTCGKCIRTETSWMTPQEFALEALGQTDTWRRDIQWEGNPLAVLIKDEILTFHCLGCSCILCKPNPDDLEDQRNDDECWVCKSKGDYFVLCDKCPRSFHLKCHLPHMEDADCGNSSRWLCTFCVYKINQECFNWQEQSREEAMSRQISQHMLQCQYILLRLCTADVDVVSANSSPSPNEFAAFKELRMFLDTIVEKLQRQVYQTIGQFVSDVELIFTNCTSHNQAAVLIAMGNRLKKMFDEDFMNLFCIV